MKLFIDTEFNGFNGDLISMALVPENDGEAFYEVLECPNPVPWVAEHVIPFLNKTPVSYERFQNLLETYLAQFDKIEIIADWPEDIQHFCRCLITGAGVMMKTIPQINFTIDRNLSSGESLVPHNALADAIAIRTTYIS